MPIVLDEKNLNTLRFARRQSYFDKSPTIRVAIGLFLACTLFFFLHFREIYVENLELHSIADKYLVAQVDFTFPDEEATRSARQEAGHQIGTLYRIDREEVQENLALFQKEFHGEQGSLGEKNAREIVSALRVLEEGLLNSRFTDLKTLNRIESMPDPPPLYFLYAPPYGSKKSRLPLSYWREIARMVHERTGMEEQWVGLILRSFENQSWLLTEDRQGQNALRRLVEEQVPERMARVFAGDRLIDKGERVTEHHIAALQAMKQEMSIRRNLWDPLTVLGSLLMTTLFLFVGISYLRAIHADVFYSNRKLGLLVSILFLSLCFGKATELLLLHTAGHWMEWIRFPLLVPFAAILLSSLMNSRIAGCAAVFLSLFFGMTLAVEPMTFLVMNLLVAMTAILGARVLRRRKDVFAVCGKAWLTSIGIALAFNLYDNTLLTMAPVIDIVATFCFLFVTAILIVGILPVFEYLFQILTDITLVEFMDPGHPLLRRLALEAPGTYQHSMVMGHIAEAAASAIGANGLFCRVATYYHDIGKLSNPYYFSENQQGRTSLHQQLTPLESAHVIIAHVSEGVALAKKSDLPEPFIDIIQEHHGTTLVYYFYHEYEKLLGPAQAALQRTEFCYSGPKPCSKESTIIMLADSVEAASRSLESFTEESVTQLVEGLLAEKAAEGQFESCLLTFEELDCVKRSMIKTLLAMTNPRIKYPKHETASL